MLVSEHAVCLWLVILLTGCLTLLSESFANRLVVLQGTSNETRIREANQRATKLLAN
jgi:hypothetical protein